MPDSQGLEGHALVLGSADPKQNCEAVNACTLITFLDSSPLSLGFSPHSYSVGLPDIPPATSVI